MCCTVPLSKYGDGDGSRGVFPTVVDPWLQAACAAPGRAQRITWFEPVSTVKATRAASILMHLDFISPNAPELLALAASIQRQGRHAPHERLPQSGWVTAHDRHGNELREDPAPEASTGRQPPPARAPVGQHLLQPLHGALRTVLEVGRALARAPHPL